MDLKMNQTMCLTPPCHKTLHWLLAVLLAVLLVLSLTPLAGCGSSGGLNSNGPNFSAEPAYQSPYDPENLILADNGRFGYWRDDRLVSRTGIDVSVHQGAIDWEAVAADGIDFAFIRIGHRGYTEGEIYVDERFEDNLLGATAAGLPIGVYFFSQAIDEDEAREEARFVLETLAGVDLAYPVVYDLEQINDGDGRANMLDARQRTENALAFCEAIEQAGYTPMIYGNGSDLSRNYLDLLAAYEFWFAEYGSSFPSGQFDFTIWQYSNTGKVAGISTNVDMNIEFLGNAG